MKSWFVIVNPVAGSGRGERDWPFIKTLLQKHSIDFDVAVTQRKFHAVELVVWAITNGYRKIICVGGDGTLNEILNGLYIQKMVLPSDVPVATIAVGTGNDWARSYNIPKDYEQCVLAIKEGYAIVQDVGRVDYFESRVKQSRYFINAAGAGFDAEVARATNLLKEEGAKGRWLYLWAILKSLVSFRSSAASVQIDGNKKTGEVFSVVLGIGKYNGGGMMQTPNALPSDGLFDVTLVSKVSRLNVVRNVFRLYNGKILKHSKIVCQRAAEVKIASNPPFNLEADGESLGTSPFSFSLVPNGVKVIVGADLSGIEGPPVSIYD